MEPTHIDEGVFDLALADVPGIGVRVGLPVGTSDHSVVFMNVVLEHPYSSPGE